MRLAHDPGITVVPVAPRGPGNLPASPTSFVGREDALAEVLELLRRHRLVTLTDPPGVGKSRARHARSPQPRLAA
jgi:hypothetical protein